jgi:formylglycine-generating enzyme required for sulfatase activity
LWYFENRRRLCVARPNARFRTLRQKTGTPDLELLFDANVCKNDSEQFPVFRLRSLDMFVKCMILVRMMLLAIVLAPVTAAAQTAVFRDCKTCPELVRIPAGSFAMGSTAEESAAAQVRPDRAAAEQPKHEVRIAQPFAIGKFEVTVAEFDVFAHATGFTTPSCLVLKGKTWLPDDKADWRNPGYEVTPRHAATCLSHSDFQRYLDWLSAKTGQRYRFPSEAEWEYVAVSGRKGSAGKCRDGNAADATFATAFPLAEWRRSECSDGYAAGSPVGAFQANKLGVFDLAGDVAEFVADCYAPNHNGAPVDGSARTAAPAICALRVVKGGSWAAEPGMTRPAVRMAIPLDVRGNGHGLRVVRELSPR